MRSKRASNGVREIIKRLRIESASEIHIKDIAMELGVYVRERILEASEARLVRKGNLGIITVNAGIPEEGRKRFAIAHELGHFELHRNSQLVFCTENDMCVWNEDKRQEIEANEFAAALLMPESLFTKYRKVEPPNMDAVIRLAKEFRTTLTSTALRYVQLSVEPCAVVISRDGIIRWYQKSEDFHFHVQVGERLSPFSYAAGFYKGVAPPAQPERVPADSWLAGNISEDAEIFENSFPLGNYNVVLSLLWVNEEIRYNARYEEEEPEFDLRSRFTSDGKRWLW